MRMGKTKPARPKHIPQRTCVVCRTKESKRGMTRLVRTSEAGVQLDLSGKMNGRGAYLCDKLECWQKALTSDALERGLRTTLSAEDRERITAAMPQPE